jgi:nucleotide-binding universal stress UspA family protein
MLEHILVGLDGSPLAESILAEVSVLAKGLNAQVTLLHVIPISRTLQSGDFYRFLGPLIQQEEIKAYGYLQQVTQRLIDAGLTVQSRVKIGDAAAEILQTATEEKVDLIALATHGRSGLRRWIYGSVAEKVLHTTHTPLLLLRPTEGQPTPSPALTHIVAPLDGSPVAESVLPLAETLAEQCGVPLVLLRVVEPFPVSFADPTTITGIDYQSVIDGLQEASESYLRHVATTLQGKGLQVQILAPLGTPAEKIVGYTHDHPGSLVVMATHGHGGLVEVLVGSVTRRVVQYGNTPSLVVRPPAPRESSSQS